MAVVFSFNVSQRVIRALRAFNASSQAVSATREKARFQQMRSKDNILPQLSGHQRPNKIGESKRSKVKSDFPACPNVHLSIYAS